MNCHIKLWSNAETTFKKQQNAIFCDNKTNVIIIHAEPMLSKVGHLVISSQKTQEQTKSPNGCCHSPTMLYYACEAPYDI